MLADRFRAALEYAVEFGDREGVSLLAAEVYDLKNELRRCYVLQESMHMELAKHKKETLARLESLRRLAATRPTSCDCCAKIG